LFDDEYLSELFELLAATKSAERIKVHLNVGKELKKEKEIVEQENSLEYHGAGWVCGKSGTWLGSDRELETWTVPLEARVSLVFQLRFSGKVFHENGSFPILLTHIRKLVSYSKTISNGAVVAQLARLVWWQKAKKTFLQKPQKQRKS